MCVQSFFESIAALTLGLQVALDTVGEGAIPSRMFRLCLESASSFNTRITGVLEHDCLLAQWPMYVQSFFEFVAALTLGLQVFKSSGH